MEKYLVNADGSLIKYTELKQATEKTITKQPSKKVPSKKPSPPRIKSKLPPGFRIRWSKLSS